MKPRIGLTSCLLLWGCVVHGQDIQTTARTAPAPLEAFVEEAPLAEAAFTPSRFNAKQQRLREHHLNVPVGALPPDREPREADVQPPATNVHATGAAAAGVILRQNRALTDTETLDATSTVCEPSLAVRGQEILVTGNWFAAFSKNGGATFAPRNPETTFPSIPNRPFCCDQVALYIPSHDLLVWFLQHSKDATGNTVRLAVAAGNDIAQERWRYYDFTPQAVGNWAQEWFDYPDLAASSQFLFITTNSFSLSDQFKRSVALRIPLQELSTYAAINYRVFHQTGVGSLRPTQGPGDTMYIGSHLNTGTLRVFGWSDAATTVQTKSFNVQPWVRGGASAPGEDGNDWLGAVDGRITAAWSTGNQQGFAWTSAQMGVYPRPHARVAILDWNAGTVTSQPHIWNSQIAFAYPGASVNSTGQIGVGLSYGGGSLFPSHTVGIRTATAWSLVSTAEGTDGPAGLNRWGDYQSMRLNGQDQTRFACMGFTLSGGMNRQNIVPRLVQFDAPSQLEPEPVPELAVIPPAEKTTGLKFSNALRKKNDGVRAAIANAKRIKAEANWIDKPFKPDNELLVGVFGNNKSFVAMDVNTDLDKHVELLRVREVGEYFFELPEDICGETDDRIQELQTNNPPWNGNCQLIITFTNGNRARGTGWFMSPRVVVTAGHCVHEGEGGNFYQSVEVIPGMNGTTMPFNSQVCPASRLRASQGWQASGTLADDYGAILLTDPFVGPNGSSPYILTPVALNDAELTGLGIGISGYPGDKATGTQWRDQGIIQSILPNRLRYSVDTFSGHSGSAVFVTQGARRAVGIHNYGGCPNKCTRITASVLSNLNSWRDEVESTLPAEKTEKAAKME